MAKRKWDENKLRQEKGLNIEGMKKELFTDSYDEFPFWESYNVPNLWDKM
jgi:hypothetical protein